MSSAIRSRRAATAFATAMLACVAVPVCADGQQPAAGTATPAGGQPRQVTEFPVRFAGPGQAADTAVQLRETDMVIGVVAGVDARAYPLNFLWDESAHTVNDQLGQRPVAVALCPLAGLGAAFERRSAGRTLDVGHVSEVELDTLVLYDVRTRSRWKLFSGEASRGPLKGQRMTPLPTLLTTWARWKDLHPATTVYVAADQVEKGFQLDAARIQRLLRVPGGPPRRADWVLGLTSPRESAAVVLRGLARTRVANETLGGRPVVVFLTADLTTALAWERKAGSRVLSFSANSDQLVDAETGSRWDALTGKAVSGPLAGNTLAAVRSMPGFWHAWKAHHPETRIIGLD